MKNESCIEHIRIDFEYFYDYEDYLNKKEIYVSGIEIAGNEINYWAKHRNTYRLKLRITTILGTDFVFPIKPYFGDIEDWVLLKYLAILEFENPPISYEFYEKGEKYGHSDSTLVKFDNKVIKSLFCINETNVSLMKFAQEFEKKSKPEEIEEIIISYFDRIEMEILEENERQAYRDQRSSRNYDSFNDEYYNDQLDMDQQGPEFWDSL